MSTPARWLTVLWTLYRDGDIARCLSVAVEYHLELHIEINGVRTMEAKGSLGDIARLAVDERHAFEALGWRSERMH